MNSRTVLCGGLPSSGILFESDPNALPPRRSFFICGRVYLKCARARWIFNIDSCGEQSPAAQLYIQIPAPSGLTQPRYLFFFFLFSIYFVIIIIFCILNIADETILLHSIFGSQHDVQTRRPCFCITPQTQLYLYYSLQALKFRCDY